MAGATATQDSQGPTARPNAMEGRTTHAPTTEFARAMEVATASWVIGTRTAPASAQGAMRTSVTEEANASPPAPAGAEWDIEAPTVPLTVLGG
mmetsp:Transcript_3920/g.6151  ORF Transcript_3920/g.6151 Transcript_3920/m.6151 type:complete len:93 (-) Transcript_3920:343-621(-)